MFNCVYLCLPPFYSCLPMFTNVYLCLSMFTTVYSCILLFAYVYAGLPAQDVVVRIANIVSDNCFFTNKFAKILFSPINRLVRY